MRKQDIKPGMTILAHSNTGDVNVYREVEVLDVDWEYARNGAIRNVYQDDDSLEDWRPTGKWQPEEGGPAEVVYDGYRLAGASTSYPGALCRVVKSTYGSGGKRPRRPGTLPGDLTVVSNRELQTERAGAYDEIAADIIKQREERERGERASKETRERIDSVLGSYLDEDRKYAVSVYARQGGISTVNISLSPDGAERLLALVEKAQS